MQLFSDPTRVRLTALVAEGELTVAELTAITRLSQSRVSTHLGRLRDAGVLRDRRAGASTYYGFNAGGMPEPASRLWELLRGQVADATLEADRARSEQVLAARAGEGWPDSIAGEMERHYSPGRTWESLARGFLGLISAGDLLDVGGGDGTVAQLLSPRCRSITVLDRSERVLEAAGRRLAGLPNVTTRRGDMHELPFQDSSFDGVLILNALQYSHAPARAVAEAARVLRPGGDLTIVTLARHDQAAVTEKYGHVNDGFEPAELEALLCDAKLEVGSCAITSRERRKPHFQVLTAFAHRTRDDR